MNATRTHETGTQRTNDGKGRHTYQPGLAAACEGCESLVYRTQTLDWELDSIIRRAKAWQYPGSKGLNHMRADDVRPITRPLSPAYKKAPLPLPPCP